VGSVSGFFSDGGNGPTVWPRLDGGVANLSNVIVRRWQAYTGASARHASTGASFDEIPASRTAVSLAKENVR
jgi:hypothetical protein